MLLSADHSQMLGNRFYGFSVNPPAMALRIAPSALYLLVRTVNF
jgi:hypothetical protein